MRAREEHLIELLCGRKYSREKMPYKRHKTQKKTILTKFGMVRYNFIYVKERGKSRTFSPLLRWLEIPKYQRLSDEFKQSLARKASRSTYQLAVEDIQDSYGFGICRQTLHTYVKQTCSGITCVGPPDPDHKVLLADGTKVRNGRKRAQHEVRVLASYGEDNGKVILAQEINKNWQDIGQNVNFKQYLVLVGDGELGLKENLCKPHMRFQMCHLHAIRDTYYYLWQDGLGKKRAEPYVNLLKQLLYTLQNSTKKYWTDKNTSRLEKRISNTKSSLKKLANMLIRHCLIQAGEFIQKHIDHLTTAAEFALIGLKVPWTTNGIERLMQEIGKRTKKKGMYWSSSGLQRILSMVLKRYVLPKNKRTYKDIFANNSYK